MLLRNIIVGLAAFAAPANAFAFNRPSLTRAATATTSKLGLMTASEIESILKEAEDCAGGECALDEVEQLLTNLQGQQSDLSKRVTEIGTLIEELEKSNGMEDRPVDEVRETVRAIFRIFQMGDKASGNDYPAMSKAMGYSGDTKGGGKTAYDVLPPKKIKKVES